MTKLHLAHRAYRGEFTERDVVDTCTTPEAEWVALGNDPNLAAHHRASLTPTATPTRVLAALGQSGFLSAKLTQANLTVEVATQPGVWHYFRLADATLTPLPNTATTLQFQRGDAYLAVSPGAETITDSPTIARFVHLRDYFNADKLASALLAHLEDLTSGPDFPVDVTVIVIEAR